MLLFKVAALDRHDVVDHQEVNVAVLLMIVVDHHQEIERGDQDPVIVDVVEVENTSVVSYFRILASVIFCYFFF